MSDDNDGIVIEGADAFYFIPPAELDKFRVDDVTAAGLKRTMAVADADEGDDEVSGFAFRPDMQPDIRPLRSFAAPLSLKGTAAPSTYGVTTEPDEW